MGSRLHGGSGTTIVPSFRFNKADDEMVEVTPTSSFEEVEDTILSHTSLGSIQTTSPAKSKKATIMDDVTYHELFVNSGPSSILINDSIDEYYGTGEIERRTIALNSNLH